MVALTTQESFHTASAATAVSQCPHRELEREGRQHNDSKDQGRPPLGCSSAVHLPPGMAVSADLRPGACHALADSRCFRGAPSRSFATPPHRRRFTPLPRPSLRSPQGRSARLMPTPTAPLSSALGETHCAHPKKAHHLAGRVCSHLCDKLR
jgi:hypothetical protein